MHFQALFDVFWKVLLNCGEKYNSIPGNLCAHIFHSRAEMYESCVHSSGAPLPKCVGFIDVKKIFMARLGGPNTNQKACYSGHKRSHYLIYLTT